MVIYSVNSFWDKNPAFLYGLSSILSFSYSIDHSPCALILLIVLSLTCVQGVAGITKRFIPLWSVNLAVLAYGLTVFHLPSVPDEGVSGILYFETHSFSTTETHFGRQSIYQGYGKHFEPNSINENSLQAKNFPCMICLPNKKNIKRPPANKAYAINGVLNKGKSGHYFFSPDNESPWIPVNNSWSLAEWRYEQKQKVKAFLFRKIPNQRSAEFLSGMVTGQFEDRVMRAEFGKLGLQHLMAISGFHFALLAGMLAFFLRIIFPQKLTVGVLMILMSSYFVFLGGSPSILRAWVMSIVTLAALLLEKKSQAANTLGAAFLFVLIYDPLLIRTIGFQFSAAVTAAILILYPVAKHLTQHFVIKRSLASMKKMSLFDQHCYCILSFLGDGVSLAFAVNLIALPLTLYYFHKFPVMSLLYNLFIPFLVSISMFLVLLSTVGFLILPPLGNILFEFATNFTHFMLNFIYNTPAPLNINWYIHKFPAYPLILYLAAVFVLGIIIKGKLERENSVDFYPKLA